MHSRVGDMVPYEHQSTPVLLQESLCAHRNAVLLQESLRVHKNAVLLQESLCAHRDAGL